MKLDDLARNRQAEPGPALLARAGIVDLLELVENASLVGGLDAKAGIHDGQFEEVALPDGADLDRTLVGELYGVAHQVQHDL